MIQQLVSFSVKRKVTVAMIACAVVAFGWVGVTRLPINLLPSLSYPSLTVQTSFINAAPAEIEQLITRPVEEVVGVLKGLKQIHSVSRAGLSEVTLEFGWDAQMSNLSMDVREKLDRLQLPLDADKPIVLRYDPALDPILKLSLTGEMNLSQLRLLADKDIKEKIERIEGVASARVQGGQQEEIHIDINQGKLAVMGISPESLSTLLSDSNINRPGGSLKNTQSQYLVRTLNEYQNLQEMRNLRITQMNQPPVTLGEVAKVSWGEKDREEIVRFNGKEGIMLAIYKEGDANTVEVAQLVKENIQRMQQDPDANFKLTVEFDQSRFIQQSIDEVKSALMMGGFLAILVLWLFLRNIRLTLIVAIAIPISVIATFIFMYRLDISLNIMSLGGLTLGVGMLLDSAIVVLESIHRHREDGQETALAAMDGTGEVGGAVLASVLTTIAVFIPIVFVEGIAGQLFKDQALTITFSLIASLIVAFTLTPMLAGLGKSTASSNPKGKLFANFVDKYKWLLHKALAHPIWLLSSSIVIFVLCLNLGKTLDNQLIPELKEGEFYFDVTLADGASLPATTELLTQMESIALNDPDVARVYLSIGSRNVSGGLSLKNKDENLGQINVVIKDRTNRIMEERVINNLRQSYQQFAAADVQFGRPGFFSLKTPVELLFFSENLPLLRQYTLSLLPKLQQIKELIDIRASLESGNPEVKIEFNRNLLAQLDLNIEEVANVLNQRVNGVVVSRFQQPDRQIDIRLRNQYKDRETLNDIENLVIDEAQGSPITLKAVAQISQTQGPSAIDRIQQSRVALIVANTKNIGLGEASNQIQQLINQNPPPIGVTFEFGGQNKEMDQSFKRMIFAASLAVFLVYLVMAATFEHLGHPFVILFTIPFSLIGVVLGLYMTGYGISVISVIGVVFLVGIVVNNAIVLVDAINQQRRQGLEKYEAVVIASQSRLRPILMTTLTTVLGLLPMAIGFGEGSELRAPLAVVVSFGLLSSTLLTLFIIPVVYMIVPSKVSTSLQESMLEKHIHQVQEMESHHSPSADPSTSALQEDWLDKARRPTK